MFMILKVTSFLSGNQRYNKCALHTEECQEMYNSFKVHRGQFGGCTDYVKN